MLPSAKLALHTSPQSIPSGVLVTVPGPSLATESVCLSSSKATVTSRGSSTSSVQLEPSPESHPCQLAKREAESGVAVSVTRFPATKLALQRAPDQDDPVAVAFARHYAGIDVVADVTVDLLDGDRVRVFRLAVDVEPHGVTLVAPAEPDVPRPWLELHRQERCVTARPTSFPTASDEPC